MSEQVWTIRGSWSGKLYGYEKQRSRAEKKKEQFKREEIPTMITKEALEGLFEELTKEN